MLLGAIGYKQKIERVSFHFNETIQWCGRCLFRFWFDRTNILQHFPDCKST